MDAHLSLATGDCQFHTAIIGRRRDDISHSSIEKGESPRFALGSSVVMFSAVELRYADEFDKAKANCDVEFSNFQCR